jgi:hypothetical protein
MTTLTCAHCKASFTHAHYCPLGSFSGTPAVAPRTDVEVVLTEIVTTLAQMNERLAKVEAAVLRIDGRADGTEG